MDPSEWKKPSDVMKIHRRRKSVSQRRITSDPDKRTSIIYKSPSKSVKRKNPFHQDSPHPFPAKRQQIDFKENKPDEHEPLSCQLFTLLDTVNEGKEQDNRKQVQSAAEVLKEQQYNDLQRQSVVKQDITKPLNKQSTSSDEKKVKDNEVSPFLPVDWSLKTKVRVVSSQPLNWCTQLKSADEAYGMEHFVKNSKSACDSTISDKRQFHRCCMYWIHPNIPWMKLFPRIIDDAKSSIVASYLLQEEVQKSLQADWEQSFTSAYHQLRSRLCPYFYLCTHQFTVLFYNGSESHSGIVVMVTPTTRGFRELLENEGIEFKLPVSNKSQSPDGKETTSRKNDDSKGMNVDNPEDIDEDPDDILDADDAAHGWLESMGLDKKQFPSLDPKKVKLQREGFRVIDHRPESLVLIEGPDVQAFFNFLLNCRTCVAMSGIQAGLPPTILSPAPFKGATLKSHKVKHTAVKQSDREGNVTQAHIVEVAGPILPHHCQGLVSLLHRTQNADYGMVCNNHDPTIPFNVLSKLIHSSNADKYENSEKLSENESKCNTSTILDSIEDGSSSAKSEKEGNVVQLDAERFHKLVPVDEDRICAIKEIVCTPEGFTWTS
ncbi:protein downstream neighbor of Son-like [Mercenaria mercenaria]|uniref:protein downstream neighbor of Son-like n=1 Tax=Mercenaria mercenaria TaxID=6596 RepID=UPI00234F4449|nr:protein downstream neighbor of Son-like [Mercenaria mercenaria]